MQFKAVTFTVSLIVNFNVRASCLKICTVFILNFGRKHFMMVNMVSIVDISAFATVNLVKISYIHARSKQE